MFQLPTEPGFIDELLSAVLILFLLGFACQLYYHWVYFRRFVFYKKAAGSGQDEQPVSVVICARDEYENLRKNLPGLLEQDYPYFEVVVVNDSSTDDTDDLLKFLSKKYGNLKVFDLKENLNFFKGKKFPLALGIKSSSYDIVLLTDADCMPVDNQWIRRMQSNFNEETDIVLGYGGYRKQAGFLNKLIRFDTMHIAIQYFSLALAGKPYMGVGRNLSYKKGIFNKQQGFAQHYKLLSGDDDLFISGTATKSNTRIEVSHESHTISESKTDFNSWVWQKRRHFTTARYYKKNVRRTLGYYGFSKALMYFLFIPLAILNFNLIVAGGALFLYMISFLIIMKKSSDMLDERDLVAISPFIDILMSFLNPFIYFFNILKKPDKWK